MSEKQQLLVEALNERKNVHIADVDWELNYVVVDTTNKPVLEGGVTYQFQRFDAVVERVAPMMDDHSNLYLRVWVRVKA